jgi:MFS family permease
MAGRELRAWFVVLSLFMSLFLVFGASVESFGVFVPYLLRHFGWSRTEMSLAFTATASVAGVAGLFIGWLLDRVEAAIVLSVSAALSGLAFIAASQANSYGFFIASYLVLGVGVGGCTMMTCSVVVANWFGERRGLAMGITMMGTSFGGMMLVPAVDYAIRSGGWRFGYQVVAAPIFLILLPLLIFVVRGKPPAAPMRRSQTAPPVEGLELGDALRTRSFWLLSFAYFIYAFVAGSMVVHVIVHLIGIGYKPSSAALTMSVIFLCASIGKIAFGVLADKVGGRTALLVDFVLESLGILLILGAHSPALLLGFAVLFGLTFEAQLALCPLVTVESLGLRSFGAISGAEFLFVTTGAAIGPVVSGRIFDVSHSYQEAFVLFVAMLIVGGLAATGCVPLSSEQARIQRRSRPQSPATVPAS